MRRPVPSGRAVMAAGEPAPRPHGGLGHANRQGLQAARPRPHGQDRRGLHHRPGPPAPRPRAGDPPPGRNPDTAALTRLLAALGVTDPATGRPLGEATALGVAAGIGFAYFVFEHEQLTTLYLGGRINSYVQKREATEAALARLGVPFQARTTRGAATAERPLRAALDQGRPVIVTVDAARFGDRSVPDWLCGMLPQDVLVEPGDGGGPAPGATGAGRAA